MQFSIVFAITWLPQTIHPIFPSLWILANVVMYVLSLKIQIKLENCFAFFATSQRIKLLGAWKVEQQRWRNKADF